MGVVPRSRHAEGRGWGQFLAGKEKEYSEAERGDTDRLDSVDGESLPTAHLVGLLQRGSAGGPVEDVLRCLKVHNLHDNLCFHKT